MDRTQSQLSWKWKVDFPTFFAAVAALELSTAESRQEMERWNKKLFFVFMQFYGKAENTHQTQKMCFEMVTLFSDAVYYDGCE